jgi:hypothetical protein
VEKERRNQQRRKREANKSTKMVKHLCKVDREEHSGTHKDQGAACKDPLVKCMSLCN